MAAMKSSSIAAAAAFAAGIAQAGASVDLGEPGALEAIRERDARLFGKIVDILRVASDVSCETLPQVLKVRHDVKEARCHGAMLLTSLPPKRHLFFILEDTGYFVNVVVGGKRAVAQPAWMAPPDPDPQAILTEAREDSEAGRYTDALEKHLWIHHKSLQHSSGFGGVRLSFALGQWKELGRRYPPALDALKQVRDDAVARVRTGGRSAEAFHELSAINAVLNEEAATAELFAWLDANRPEVAKQMFILAQNALVATRNYALAGKYLHPAMETDRITGMYRMTRRTEKSDGLVATFARRHFANRAATLVALLVVNGRKAEADAAIEEFLKELPDDSFRAQLDEAARGIVPEPWPPRLGS